MTRLSALIALCLWGSAAVARPADLSSFDVSRLQGWPEALAVCDLTSFLRTGPDLKADVILARDDAGGTLRTLYGPRFVPPTLFFDQDVRRAFHRLQRAGEVDRGAVAEARARLDRPMLRSYEQASMRERLFLQDQARLCDGLFADVARRHP